MSTLDIPKLRKYVEWVEEQETLKAVYEAEYDVMYAGTPQLKQEAMTERTWNQNQWFEYTEANVCGTAHCLAGKVVLDEHGLEWVNANRDKINWAMESDRILGLGEFTYHDMYQGSNTAADIRRKAEAVVDQATNGEEKL